MSSPLLALRAAIRSACLADPALATLMGGEVRLYDEPPRGSPPVYAVFGEASARDASTSSEHGHEHEFAIVLWAREGSAASALAAAGRMADLLDDAPLTLAGHRLVRIAVAATESDRDAETRLARTTLRLGAATEVAG